MKKGGFLRNVLDTIRSNQASGQSGRGSSSSADRGLEFGGQLKPSHFALGQVSRHGFPEHPSALAFDPVQKIAAIGTKSGAIRIFGRPGVDVWVQHEPAFAVTHIRFIVNQGALITVTSDESIHLWSLRGPNLKLHFSTSGQGGGAGGPSAVCSPAPTPASTISSISPQSGGSSLAATTSGGGGVSSLANTPSSFLGQITDTVTGAVDSASDFLSGGSLSDHQQATPSPTSGIGSDPATRAWRQPELLHTLKFQREHITCIHQTLSSKWLYIGTERGNVHVANVETFELSGYSIAWNKAIELSRKTHPGSIIHLSECPQDTNKLLIGYESGCIALWDLKQRNADGRYYDRENLLWLAWHYEGKQFMAAHGDGSLITWLTRSNAKPASISYPHAKTAASSSGAAAGLQESQFGATGIQLQASSNLASSIARSLNNELYRPINKVEWKTSKSTNEQFMLFSGGLPYDNLDQTLTAPAAGQALGQDQQTTASSRQSTGPSPARFAPISSLQQQQQQPHQQSFLKATQGLMSSPSPMSPSISPNLHPDQNRTGSASITAAAISHNDRQSTNGPSRGRRSLRSTTLTVMYGKSITVLELDDMIVDFITVCDNSPYENDTSDPYAVIVLLSNELVLIDLTSSGYPTFDSPYPSASLNESPVTCVQYLADCTTDLIPFLYSTSQNAVSRAPKKGYSDKEWPINGGEWGQSMQSYPELVMTGHADGTIKFWDMSGINFDLISKIKTSKLFERPNKLPGPILFTTNSSAATGSNASRRQGTSSGVGGLRSGSPFKTTQQTAESDHHLSSSPTGAISGVGAGLKTPLVTPDNNNESSETNLAALDESLFAIEKIEFCPSTKRLLVAGAFSQVIQFKLNKKEAHSAASSGGSAPASAELTTILVEPASPTGTSTSGTSGNSGSNQHHQQALTNSAASIQQFKQHLLLRVRDTQTTGATGSSSGGSSSSAVSSSHRSRGLSGFQAELVCLTPLLVTSLLPNEGSANIELLGSISAASAGTTQSIPASPYYCQMPSKISALAFQAAHNILAYSHENGIVLVDVIQKCLIMNATLSDLYGGTALTNASRDVSIQPFATSSILQHHYLATGSGGSEFAIKYNNGNNSAPSADNGQTIAENTSASDGRASKLAGNGTAPNGGKHDPNEPSKDKQSDQAKEALAEDEDEPEPESPEGEICVSDSATKAATETNAIEVTTPPPPASSPLGSINDNENEPARPQSLQQLPPPRIPQQQQPPPRPPPPRPPPPLSHQEQNNPPLSGPSGNSITSLFTKLIVVDRQ